MLQTPKHRDTAIYMYIYAYIYAFMGSVEKRASRFPAEGVGYTAKTRWRVQSRFWYSTRADLKLPCTCRPPYTICADEAVVTTRHSRHSMVGNGGGSGGGAKKCHKRKYARVD